MPKKKYLPLFSFAKSKIIRIEKRRKIIAAIATIRKKNTLKKTLRQPQKLTLLKPQIKIATN